ncbi:cupin domain-containing protein [Pseudarthrobacter sp. NamB4]|uniref:cupin domain-containing protein n=1 Tax=Pseudarthrobacter sp. NamB4 TaxID=2576837 RepID=UPI0014851A5F|nr:cupin domain-containing protein [Pseudarthrobacter sp. NamB4]
MEATSGVPQSGRDDEYFLGTDHGRLVDLGGLGVRFKIYSEQTGGSFAVVEHPIEPGVLVEPHIHQHEDELSYVVSGTIWARVGDTEIEAPAGTYVWKPRHVLHTFWNPGPEPALIVETISPGGFERLFEQIAALLQDPGPTTDEDVVALCTRYGLVLDQAWVPELQARFGPMRMV